MISRERYEELVSKRDGLSKVLAKATLDKHIQMINEQLKPIREELSNAHREQYNGNKRTK